MGHPFYLGDLTFDEAPCDYNLWVSVTRRSAESSQVMSDFVDSLDENEVRRVVNDIRPRDELCIKIGGRNFESQLKKKRRGTIEE